MLVFFHAQWQGSGDTGVSWSLRWFFPVIPSSLGSGSAFVTVSSPLAQPVWPNELRGTGSKQLVTP